MSTFKDLFSQHVASSWLKQQQLGEIIGNRSWQVDLDTGVLSFGDGLNFPVQMIGTESERDGTWLWSWANTGSNIPPALLVCAQSLQQLGEAQGIAELTQPEIDLSQVSGHFLTMIASGVCNADAYYRGPYQGGAAFFTLQSLPPRQTPMTVMLVNVLSSVIMQFDVDHRLMTRSFLTQQGYQVTESDTQLIASAPNDRTITVNFNERGAISGMDTTAKPEYLDK